MAETAPGSNTPAPGALVPMPVVPMPIVPMHWDTADVAPGERFDYYREALCQSFMPLRPELASPERSDFGATVSSYAMDASTLNLVWSNSHEVNRGRYEISRSPDACYYINLQLRGHCRIVQNGGIIDLHPGDVGIFSSDDNFVLDHGNCSTLSVASLMVPHDIFHEEQETRLGEPWKLSLSPLYGTLLTEAFKTQSGNIGRLDAREAARMQALIVQLSRLASGDRGDETPAAGANGIPQVRLYGVKTIIRRHLRQPGYAVSDCAAEAGISPRYVHKLFRSEDDTFSGFLWRERLMLAAQELRRPENALSTIADIALACGYADISHFHRQFQQRYGMAPGNWRRLP